MASMKIKNVKNISDKLLSMIKIRHKVGLALGGGAARGIAHVGVLKVLKEAGIPIHVIAGTSSGALFGALFAGGMDMREMVESTTRAGWHRLIRVALTRRGAVSGELMERLVEDSIGFVRFTDLKIPFAAVASDLRTGEKVVLREGSVAKAVHASSAIPGVFVPVNVGGRLLCDGMVTDNVPVDVARDMGADIVIAVDVVPKVELERDPDNMIEVVERSLDVGVRVASREIASDADFLIEPVTKNFRPLALNHAGELIEMGQAAAKTIVGRIKRKLFLQLKVYGK
jgi:NTE family protein